MTAFTDDLDNDLEGLAKHHDVTPVQVAHTAFRLVPEDVRLSLLLTMLESLPDGLRRALDRPVAEVASAIEPSAKLPLARALFRSMPSRQEEPLSPHTGLPQELRGAIHELGRKYPRNLVADAAMLEMPRDVREDVARAFLPKRTFREKIAEATAVRSQLVVRASGRVLYEQLGEYYGPGNLLITEDDETSARYTADANGVQGGTVEHEIKADGSRVIRTYYRPVVAG